MKLGPAALGLAIAVACGLPGLARAQPVRFAVAPVGALEICVEPAGAQTYRLTAIAASRCLSSSCRGFVRSTLRVRIGGGDMRIAGDLLHRKPVGRVMCTADCSGAKRVVFATVKLGAGRYLVSHNGRVMGRLAIRSGGGTVCIKPSKRRRRSRN